MRKISQKSISDLIRSQMEIMANDSSEQYSVAANGYKGVHNMSQEELEAEFKSHGLKIVYEKD